MVELMEQINSKLDNLGHPIMPADIQSSKHTNTNNNKMPEIKPNLEIAVDNEIIKQKEDKRKISDILTKEYHLSDLFSKEDEKHNLER